MEVRLLFPPFAMCILLFYVPVVPLGCSHNCETTPSLPPSLKSLAVQWILLVTGFCFLHTCEGFSF